MREISSMLEVGAVGLLRSSSVQCMWELLSMPDPEKSGRGLKWIKLRKLPSMFSFPRITEKPSWLCKKYWMGFPEFICLSQLMRYWETQLTLKKVLNRVSRIYLLVTTFRGENRWNIFHEFQEAIYFEMYFIYFKDKYISLISRSHVFYLFGEASYFIYSTNASSGTGHLHHGTGHWQPYN